MAVLHTSIATSTSDSILVRGHDLSADLMGNIGLGEMAYLLVAGRLPNPHEARLFNAVLVSLCEHGMTPAAVASRIAYTSAPESVPGAIAAGVLCTGDVFLGVTENTARMLSEALDGVDAYDEDVFSGLAVELVEEYERAGRRIPGFGHRFHDVDPRAGRLRAIAKETGHDGLAAHLVDHIAVVLRERGKVLPVNGAGAAGAALLDLGLDPSIMRGLTVVARVAGLVGHLHEEMRVPMGRSVLDLVLDATEYTGPAAGSLSTE